jgi:hypothetical protein
MIHAADWLLTSGLTTGACVARTVPSSQHGRIPSVDPRGSDSGHQRSGSGSRPRCLRAMLVGPLTARVDGEPNHVHEESHVPDTVFLPDRIEVTRPIPASPSEIFDILRSPAGHVAIDASGMLQDFTGEPAEKVGDAFVIHMDRESLNDVPLGRYNVTVHIIAFERDKEIAWDLGPDIPVAHFYGYRLDAGEDGVTNVTSYYDWSKVSGDAKQRFPIVPESALRATLGILERTVRKGL